MAKAPTWGLLCSGPLRSLRAGLAEGQLCLHLLWGPLPWAGQGLRRERFRPQCASSGKPSQIAQLSALPSLHWLCFQLLTHPLAAG